MSKVEVRPTKAGHQTYYLDGKRLPSVTTIISGNLGWNTRILMAWQAKLFRSGQDPDNVLETACDIGSLTHNMIEHHIFGADEIDVGDADITIIGKAKRGLDSYIEWETAHGVEYLESEIAMGSKELSVAGTADAIAMVDGKTTLIDFKTSKNVYSEHIIQLGAYKALVGETTGYDIEQCMVIHINKADDIKESDRIKSYVIDDDMVEQGLNTFKQLRSLHEDGKVYGKFLRKLTKLKK